LLRPHDFLAFLEKQGSRWIRGVRAAHRPLGRVLTPSELEAVGPFFDDSLLRTVRIARVRSIANPDFYSFLLAQSIAIPLDFTQMAAITFVDTILVSERQPLPAHEDMPLLFHELVHVVQYNVLGIDEFVRRYVRGWAANGFQYSRIPLERWAYELDARFRAGAAAFSVSGEVERQFAGFPGGR
jgi:hypothetical protein